MAVSWILWFFWVFSPLFPLHVFCFLKNFHLLDHLLLHQWKKIWLAFFNSQEDFSYSLIVPILWDLVLVLWLKCLLNIFLKISVMVFEVFFSFLCPWVVFCFQVKFVSVRLLEVLSHISWHTYHCALVWGLNWIFDSRSNIVSDFKESWLHFQFDSVEKARIILSEALRYFPNIRIQMVIPTTLIRVDGNFESGIH